MNIIYTFKQQGTFLASSPQPSQPAVVPAAAQREAPSATTVFVLHARTVDGDANAQREVQEDATALAGLHREVLSFAHHTLLPQWRRQRRDGSSREEPPAALSADAVPDLEAGWGRTAPLPPTAVLTCATATLPLFRVIAASPPSEVGGQHQPQPPQGQLYFLYEHLSDRHFYFPAASGSAGEVGGTDVAAREETGHGERQATSDPFFYSTWDSYLIAAHAAVFDSSRTATSFLGAEPHHHPRQSRLCLQQYLDRCPGHTSDDGAYSVNTSVSTTPGTTPPYASHSGNRAAHSSSTRGLYSVAVWSEETLWRLLNALVSVLAVYHAAGLHFSGEIHPEDILCFALSDKLAGQLREVHRSLSSSSTATTTAAAAARESASGQGTDGGHPEHRWAAQAESFMRMATSGVVLPLLFLDGHTPSHRSFFLLNRLPQSSLRAGTGDGNGSGGPDVGCRRNEGEKDASPEMVSRHQADDIRCVGRILLAVAQARAGGATRGANDDDGGGVRGGGGEISSEFLFLARRMAGEGGTEGSATAAGTTTTTTTTPSALHLCQLQALRLRVHAWVYRLLAEERAHLARVVLDDAERERLQPSRQHGLLPVNAAAGAAGPSSQSGAATKEEEGVGGRSKAHARKKEDKEEGDKARARWQQQLESREQALREREDKLNAVLHLYELGHERLDALPNAGDAGYAQLRHQLQLWRREGEEKKGLEEQEAPSRTRETHAWATTAPSSSPPPTTEAEEALYISPFGSAVKERVGTAIPSPAAIGASGAAAPQGVARAAQRHEAMGKDEGEEDPRLRTPPPLPRRPRDHAARWWEEPPSPVAASMSGGMADDVTAADRDTAAHAGPTPLLRGGEVYGDAILPRPAHGSGEQTKKALDTAFPHASPTRQEEEEVAVGLVTPKQPTLDPLGRGGDTGGHSTYSSLLSSSARKPAVPPSPYSSPSQVQRQRRGIGESASPSPGQTARRTSEDWIRHQQDALRALRATFEQASATAQPRSRSGSRGATPQKEALETARQTGETTTSGVAGRAGTQTGTQARQQHATTMTSPPPPSRRALSTPPRAAAGEARAAPTYVPFFSSFDDLRRSPPRPTSAGGGGWRKGEGRRMTGDSDGGAGFDGSGRDAIFLPSAWAASAAAVPLPAHSPPKGKEGGKRGGSANPPQQQHQQLLQKAPRDSSRAARTAASATPQSAGPAPHTRRLSSAGSRTSATPTTKAATPIPITTANSSGSSPAAASAHQRAHPSFSTEKKRVVAPLTAAAATPTPTTTQDLLKRLRSSTAAFSSS